MCVVCVVLLNSRAEILGALASVLMIWALVGVLVYEAILRLIADIKYALGVPPPPSIPPSPPIPFVPVPTTRPGAARREEGETLDGRIMTIIGGMARDPPPSKN